jgi:hypothetical protein
MLNDTEVGGLKRIVGSFSEAAAFAYATLGLLAFTGRLWLSGVYPRITFTLSFLSLCALFFATSTTGYAGLSIIVVIGYFASLKQAVTGRINAQTLCFIFAVPVVTTVLVLVLALNDAQWLYVRDMLDTLIFNKLSSDSGVERTGWNRQALVNFVETFGLGAGIGSLRASSFLVAVLASIGIIGAITYGAFLVCVLLGWKPYRRDDDLFVEAAQAGARSACLAYFVAASVAGSFVDLGLVFFAFAALACAEPVRTRSYRFDIGAYRFQAAAERPPRWVHMRTGIVTFLSHR